MLPFLTTECDRITHVPTPDELAAQLDAVRRVKAARLYRERITRTAQDNLREAILDALDTGASVADVATAAGFSRQWVDKLRRSAGR